MNYSILKKIWKRYLNNKSFLIGIVLSLIMILTGLISKLWTPYSVEIFDIANKLEGPSSMHWLGTDHFGRDMTSMLMAGAWNSMIVSVFAIGLGAGIGIPLGIFAAGKKGWSEPGIRRCACDCQ